jgi:hypothetical protein
MWFVNMQMLELKKLTFTQSGTMDAAILNHHVQPNGTWRSFLKWDMHSTKFLAWISDQRFMISKQIVQQLCGSLNHPILSRCSKIPWVNLMDNFYTWHSLGQVLKSMTDGERESLALVA